MMETRDPKACIVYIADQHLVEIRCFETNNLRNAKSVAHGDFCRHRNATTLQSKVGNDQTNGAKWWWRNLPAMIASQNWRGWPPHLLPGRLVRLSLHSAAVFISSPADDDSRKLHLQTNAACHQRRLKCPTDGSERGQLCICTRVPTSDRGLSFLSHGC